MVIQMISSFFSRQYKLALISFIVFASFFICPMVKADTTEDLQRSIVLLSIHEAEHSYYVILDDVMVQQPAHKDIQKNRKTFKKPEEVPLAMSRKEYKKMLNNSLLSGRGEDLLQE